MCQVETQKRERNAPRPGDVGAGDWAQGGGMGLVLKRRGVEFSLVITTFVASPGSYVPAR